CSGRWRRVAECSSGRPRRRAALPCARRPARSVALGKSAAPEERTPSRLLAGPQSCRFERCRPTPATRPLPSGGSGALVNYICSTWTWIKQSCLQAGIRAGFGVVRERELEAGCKAGPQAGLLAPQQQPMDASIRDRYSRQILFPLLGEQGQENLLRSRAVVVGCGALGSLHANALARAGAGQIVIIDRDYVEANTLQRQWLFDESDAAEALPKAIAAQRKLAAINSSIRIHAAVADLTPQNAEELLLPAGVILDGTDNFEARYLINDVAVKHGVPWIYG